MTSTVRDRVKESTTTTGTGNITLAGAPTGFQTFNTAFGVGQRFFYTISSSGSAEWETGQGYLSASTTLVRELVKTSSNADAAVSFSAGTKDVFCALVSDMAITRGQMLASGMGAALN